MKHLTSTSFLLNSLANLTASPAATLPVTHNTIFIKTPQAINLKFSTIKSKAP